jgi:predicted DNA-binding transcriptional regulator
MASKDQMMGAGILIVSIVIIILYLYWLFFTPYYWWAIVVPVLIAVLAVLGIAAWIGYTMATTPPPKPLEDIPELKETEEKK